MSLLSTKQITERFKLSYQTVNYYTNLGLFNTVERRGNMRMYNEQEVREKLESIVSLKNQGYPLRLIIKKINNEVKL